MMEENQTKLGFDITDSNWKIKKTLLQTSRNSKMVECRLQILQNQKKKKIKEIECKLSTHKKNTQLKMYKNSLSKTINWKNQSHKQNQELNVSLIRELRHKRAEIVAQKKAHLLDENKNKSHEIKDEHHNNAQSIKQNKLQNYLEKTKKRNRVRLIEIQSKENINHFWESKLSSFQEEKLQDRSQYIRQYSIKRTRLAKLQRNERVLLTQLRKADQVNLQITQVIDKDDTICYENLTKICVQNFGGCK